MTAPLNTLKARVDSRKVMIVGLDCAEPSLVFERWRDQLPVLRALMASGAHGRLTSVIPPITVPAWSCMMASQTPGDLGVYGFRNRADRSYDEMFIADATAIRAPRLWDLMTRVGRRSIVLGVPGTYPPTPIDGTMVSCFLAPSTDSAYTYPPDLADEIAATVGPYALDCPDFRTDDKDYLRRQVYDMTRRRFDLANHLLATRPWDFFAMVEIGLDRMHHGFWKHMDPEHRKHPPESRHRDAIFDYYRYLDRRIGELLSHAGPDTVVLVVSDHGCKRLDGGIRINEWLRREGFLVTLREPRRTSYLSEVGVDWSRTAAWGEGGYYGRLFLNVRGREPNGTVPPQDYDRVRDELARRLAAIDDERGRPLRTQIFRPEEIYPRVEGVAPDLIIHFDDLAWRAVGTVGGDEGIHTTENDTGPDDANHAQDGILILSGPGVPPGPRAGMHLLDVAPTVLEFMGIEAPAAMRGSSLLRGQSVSIPVP